MPNKDSSGAERHISEIITIYRRLKKGSNNDIYSAFDACTNSEVQDIAEVKNDAKNFFNFGRFKSLRKQKYIYLDKTNNLIQSNNFFRHATDLLEKKNFWLNIFDPKEVDFLNLVSTFNVHELTIRDLRDGKSREKIEAFKHYTFIVLKLYSDREKDVDINFNILIFKNFVITTHDKPWSSVMDIANFVYLLNRHTSMSPEWVLFSILVELLQDVGHLLDNLEKEVHENVDLKKNENFKNVDVTTHKQFLRKNFDNVYTLYSIQKFIKPKINILKTIKTKYQRKLSPRVSKHVLHSLKDFLRLESDSKELYRILERSQDLLIALVNLDMSREGNEMNKVMKRFSVITFVFLPMQAVSGLWGMNCKVPFDGRDESSIYFWMLTIFGLLIGLLHFTLADFNFFGWKLFKKKVPKKENILTEEDDVSECYPGNNVEKIDFSKE